jgi:hypothetical protein
MSGSLDLFKFSVWDESDSFHARKIQKSKQKIGGNAEIRTNN